MSNFTPYPVSVEDMMRARDERVQVQNEMLAAAASFPAPTALLSFGMNIPGAVKQTPLIRSGFLFGKERLTELLHREDYALLMTHELRRVSGDTWLCLVGAPPEAVKRLAVALEDSEPLARLFDIDVLNCEGQKLSREDFSLPPRRCLLCEETAVVCARSRAHFFPAAKPCSGRLFRSPHLSSPHSKITRRSPSSMRSMPHRSRGLLTASIPARTRI